ncbi:hypothetical protein [Nonomuraea longicatena]|uniref:Uncharacterized protein n=1 Tax=Nonomuraea longicatena TaxID=83682 RepID=A0ABN1PMG7_9ACTN
MARPPNFSRCWSRDIPGFGVAWVDPSPGGIALGVPTAFLPDVVAQLMPTIAVEELSRVTRDGYGEIDGVPGLRHRIEGRTAVLSVPGLPVRIDIPLAEPGLWEKAVLIAREYRNDGVVFLWDSHSLRWHPAERAFTMARLWKYGAGGHLYRHSAGFGRAAPHPGDLRALAGHELWFNPRVDEYEIQFAWQNSGTPREFLGLLLDRRDGLRVTPEPGGGTRPVGLRPDDDYARVRLRRDSANLLDLRPYRFEPRSDDAVLTSLLTSRQRRRLERERVHGYPPSRTHTTAHTTAHSGAGAGASAD